MDNNYVYRSRFADEAIKDGITTYCAHGVSVLTHSHEWLELAYLEEGHILHTVGDTTYTLDPGEYFFIEPNQPHSYISVPQKPISLMNIIFLPQLIDPTLNHARELKDIYNHYLIHIRDARLDRSPSQMKFIDSDGQVRQQIRNIFEEVSEKKPGWKESVRGLLIYIIIRMLRNAYSSDKPDVGLHLSEPIINYVQSHYMEAVKITDAFKNKSYSTAYLSRQFHRETGITFSNFLKHTRIDASCRLLANTENTVSEIAETVGYHDTTFFHSTFREIVGMSPLDYRKRFNPTKG